MMAGTNVDNCGVCAKLVKNSENAVMCELNCYAWFHIKCTSLSERSYKTLQGSKSPYKCDTCKSSDASTIQQLCATVKLLQECVEELKSELKSKLDNFKTVEGEFGKLREDQKQVSEKLKKQNNDINWLYDAQNESEQYSKNQNIEIKGIPIVQNEDCLAIVRKIGDLVGCEINESDLDGCHRLRQTKSNNPPSIVARFVRKTMKREVMKKRKEKGSVFTSELGIPGDNHQIFLNDHLTAYNRKLLAKAIEGKKQGKLDAAWTSFGKVFVKKSQKDRPTQVKDLWSIEDLCEARGE